MMHRLLGITLVLVLVVCSFATAADTPQAIVDKAIQAGGGAEKLAKTRTMVQTAKGQIMSFGAAVPATSEVTMHLPDRARWAFELDAGEQKVPVLLTLNGEKGWRSGGGAVKEMTKEEVQEQRERGYSLWLTTLLPLKDRDVELAALPDARIGDDETVGIKVTKKGRPEVKLYFNKKTNQLLKLERKGKDAGQDATFEHFLSDYKDYEGLKLASRHIEQAAGKKVADWTVSGYKFPARLDESLFGKP